MCIFPNVLIKNVNFKFPNLDFFWAKSIKNGNVDILVEK